MVAITFSPLMDVEDTTRLGLLIVPPDLPACVFHQYTEKAGAIQEASGLPYLFWIACAVRPKPETALRLPGRRARPLRSARVGLGSGAQHPEEGAGGLGPRGPGSDGEGGLTMPGCIFARYTSPIPKGIYWSLSVTM